MMNMNMQSARGSWFDGFLVGGWWVSIC